MKRTTAGHGARSNASAIWFVAAAASIRARMSAASVLSGRPRHRRRRRRTILKAFLKPDFILPAPVELSADGSQLVAYTGKPLTLGGEIDKFAANYAYGRDMAGVHFRSDSLAGLRLGEAAAISVLRDRAALAGGAFGGFRFRSFDGQQITIG